MAAALSAVRRALRERRERNANRCHIYEEYDGSFIGRRTCSTHGTRWDDGLACPAVRP